MAGFREMAVSFEDVTFSYGDVPILNGTSFGIAKGECVALVGPNGSGKSTIAELICALMKPDSGTIEVLGQITSEIKGDSELLKLRGSIGFALQNPDDQFVEPIVLDEVAFGPSNLGLPSQEIIDRIEDALQQVGATDLIRRSVSLLSGGEKQRIAIADALAIRPQILILDEPTSMLDIDGRMEILQVIEKSKRSDVTLLLLTHSIEEMAAADRILKIEDGIVRESSLDEMTRERGVLHSSTLPTLASDAQQRDALSQPMIPMQPIIRIESASFAYDLTRNRIMGMFSGEDAEHGRNPRGDIAPRLALDSVSLDVLTGEVLAIYGPNGCGKSTLAQLMNGLLKPTSGEVFVDGVSTSDKCGANMARRVVGLCGQFPERTFFKQTAREEIAFAPINHGLNAEETANRVRLAADAVGIDDRVLESNPIDLSGGEQRKVAIASILSMQPKVIVLDEPCSGLDFASHARVLKTIIDLKSQGTTIVLISHDNEDIELLADRRFEMQA